MDARFYNSEEIDIQRLANDLENMYRVQGYEVQQIGNKDQMMVQLKKGSDLVALLGLQAALSVSLQHTAGGTVAVIGRQKWMDKAAVGAVGLIAWPLLWPLVITAGGGAVRQPDVRVGPVPVQFVPQIQQQWAPPPPAYMPSTPQYVPPAAPQYVPASRLRCPSCNTPYDEGDTFCSGCGRSLAPQKKFCPNCKAEIKPGLAYCPKCGASTFQSSPPTQAATTPVSSPTIPAYKHTTT